MIVMENIAFVLVVMENITVEYLLDLGDFESRIVAGVDDTQVVDKPNLVSFAFQTEDTVVRKHLCFVTMGLLSFCGLVKRRIFERREVARGDSVVAKDGETPRQNDERCISPYRLL
ncbi:hypothetical protein Tco_0700710 [Tanacetum coccineum]